MSVLKFIFNFNLLLIGCILNSVLWSINVNQHFDVYSFPSFTYSDLSSFILLSSYMNPFFNWKIYPKFKQPNVQFIKKKVAKIGNTTSNFPILFFDAMWRRNVLSYLPHNLQIIKFIGRILKHKMKQDLQNVFRVPDSSKIFCFNFIHSFLVSISWMDGTLAQVETYTSSSKFDEKRIYRVMKIGVTFSNLETIGTLSSPFFWTNL